MNNAYHTLHFLLAYLLYSNFWFCNNINKPKSPSFGPRLKYLLNMNSKNSFLTEITVHFFATSFMSFFSPGSQHLSLWAPKLSASERVKKIRNGPLGNSVDGILFPNIYFLSLPYFLHGPQPFSIP